MLRLVQLYGFVGLVLALPVAVVRAQELNTGSDADLPTLASIQASFDAADFASAVRELSDLLERGALAPAELTRAVGLLALSSRGAGDDDALDRALLLLSLVDGADAALAGAPPSLRTRYERVRASRADPEVTVDAREDGDELVLRAAIEPAVPHTVLRVHARRGRGEWQHARDELRLSLDASIEYYATLDLAGVAVRETERARHAPAAVTSVPEAALRLSEEESGDDSAVWWAVGSIGAAAAIGAAIAIGVVASQPGAPTTVVVGPT